MPGSILNLRLILIGAFFVLPADVQSASAYRQKRVSDQRLAELETKVALSGLKGKMRTIPYGYGSIDPEKIGRRRRSTPWPCNHQSLLEHQLDNSIGAGSDLADQWLIGYELSERREPMEIADDEKEPANRVDRFERGAEPPVGRGLWSRLRYPALFRLPDYSSSQVY